MTVTRRHQQTGLIIGMAGTDLLSVALTSHALPMTQDFIDRAGPEILKGSLPVKTEFVVGLALNEHQEVMYRAYMEALEQGGFERQLFRVGRCVDESYASHHINVHNLLCVVRNARWCIVF